VRLNIWDVGGQATLRPYWQNYYERTDALLWVCMPADLIHHTHACGPMHACVQSHERLQHPSLP
jgi:ADP-ribosylation factor-like protein 2